MKKVINGKMYNTDTANACAAYGKEDFCETLLKKRTGEYFLFVEGDGMSNFTHDLLWNLPYYMDFAGSDKKIIPLSINEAKEWTETYCDGEKYEMIFGTVEE